MIRCMCVNFEGTWIAAGFSSGHLSVLDLRGGILKSQWKAHETDVIKVRSMNKLMGCVGRSVGFVNRISFTSQGEKSF